LAASFADFDQNRENVGGDEAIIVFFRPFGNTLLESASILEGVVSVWSGEMDLIW
jgi:hypothetical protein